MTTIEKWFHDMRQIWIDKTPERIADILSSDQLAYFETPFSNPLTHIEDVVREWQAIKNQNIEYITIDILNQTKNVGAAMWSFKQSGYPESRGCYYLELDNNGKCTVFRQWWNTQ